METAVIENQREAGISRAKEYDPDFLALWERAHHGTSHSPQYRGYLYVCSFLDDMESDIKAVHDAIEAARRAGATVEPLPDGWDKDHIAYCKVANCAWASAKASCLSPMIAGPANFPTRRAQKASDSESRRAEEYQEARAKSRKRALNSALPHGDGSQIRSDDPDAEIKLTAKIDRMKSAHEAMKSANRIVKKYAKTGATDDYFSAMLEININREQAEQLLKPDFCGRVGFASYSLTNNLANIKRLEQRLVSIKALRGSAAEWNEQGKVWKMYREDERICIEFDERLTKEAYQFIRKNAWLWSRKNNRFQRKDTANARHAWCGEVGPYIKKHEAALFEG